MSRIKIENNILVITMQGARKFFAMKNELSIPLENISGVTTGLAWKDVPKIWDKRIGSNLYSFYFGGTFRQNGAKVFYDLKKKEDAVVISLNDTDFDTLIIGVDDPTATVETIEQALKEKERS